ncbi:lipopolysaccharide biosynthesis protein [Devosia aurantiaca]|uniref:Uncharacterized protein n=1 Tax=Devosia aurantiaca TaxID=2714858 RepID=A0A6M1SE44_9HYPH|nr:hypothetical protein [Devosia aurantiaca]NGP17867.1 hypothetical protein [Devosia aurantiaca]
MGAVARRIAQGTAANLLGKFWVLALQLLMLPALTRLWGAELYGVWLLLTTIPTYLALSEAGLGTVAAVDLTRKFVSGDQAGALQLVQSLWSLMTAVSVGLGIVIASISAVMVFGHTVHFEAIGPGAVFAAIVFIALYALIVVQMVVLNIVYRATNQYALGTFLLDAATPVEGVVVLCLAWSGQDIAVASLGMLVVRALFGAVYFICLRPRTRWLKLGVQQAQWSSIRPLLRPSAAAFSLIGANAVILQGMIVVLGVTGGAMVVAVFAASRTISRVPLQLANLVSRASVPELTRAQAMGHGLSHRLLVVNIGAALAVSVPSALALTVFGPALLDWVSAGALGADAALFAWLGAGAVAGALWTSASSALVASNELGRFAYWYLAACLGATGYVFVSDTADVELAAIAVLVAELVALAAVAIRFWPVASLRPLRRVRT